MAAMKYKKELSYTAYVDIPTENWLNFLHLIRPESDYRVSRIPVQWDWVEEYIIKYYDGGVDRDNWNIWFRSEDEMIKFKLAWL